jgi:hypothetical protein
MGSRVLPLSLVVGALLADGVGAHRVAYYLLLLAVIGAAAAAFLGAGDVLEGKDDAGLRGITTCVALVLLVLGAAVRANAPAGGSVPHLGISAAVAAVLVYGLPVVGWLLEPLRPRRRESQRVRAARAGVDAPAAHAEAA